MKNGISKLVFNLTLGAIVSFGTVNAQEQKARESFEDKTSLENIVTEDHSIISLSSDHFRFGTQALKWEYEGETAIKIENFRILSKDESPLKYGDHFPASPVTVVSIYNEKMQQDSLKVSFGSNSIDEVWFQLPLNFTGWRTIRVPFYEMSGAVPKKGAQIAYDFVKYSATNPSSKGTVYLEDMVFSQFHDDRHAYPDEIVPFIKRDVKPGTDHWMPLIRDINRVEGVQLQAVSGNEQKELNLVVKRIDEKFQSKSQKKDNTAKAQQEFDKLGLTVGNYVTGKPLTHKISEVYFSTKNEGIDNCLPIENFGKSIKKIAGLYYSANATSQKEIEVLFINATKYYLDQGWQKGSNGGTRHHIGYNVRELADAFYMMRAPLSKAGLLNDVGSSLHWLFNLGKVLGPESEYHANIDYFNTQSFYHLMLIFMTDDIEKQAALLRGYSNYMSLTLAQEDGVGVFKVDGTAWHHGGHYPAYAMGAFRNVPEVIHTLSGTAFKISEAGHSNFKRAFLAARKYSQTFDFGFGVAGRHPLEDNSIKTLKDEFIHMAYSGMPDGTNSIDTDIASAYLRIWGKTDRFNKSIFVDNYGVKTEKLEGYDVFPYAALSVHRRDNWAAFIKGYSKYVWASEIYVDENRYGRYPSNGSIQINNEKGNIKSGFKQDGWDWNRFPGTTIVYLPFEELEPDTPLLMFRSIESFAGAVELNGNGVFAMKLNETAGTNADGPETDLGFPAKLKANKSVFSFEDKLICLGTGIESVDAENPVETNLFQNYLPKSSKEISFDKHIETAKFPLKENLEGTENWVIDAYHNGYYVLSDSKLTIERKEQESYHNKYSIKTGKMNRKGKGATITKGNYASAWLSHGTAPKNASYAYVIYPNVKAMTPKEFAKKAKKDDSYTIVKQDDVAHIVKDETTHTTGYAIFDADLFEGKKILNKVSVPSLLMLNDAKEKITLSLVQPDLNFSDAEDKTERGYSNPVNLEVTLNGTFELKETTEGVSIELVHGKTIVSAVCQHGFSKKIELLKK